jgi:hypothetical protein
MLREQRRPAREQRLKAAPPSSRRQVARAAWTTRLQAVPLARQSLLLALALAVAVASQRLALP